MERNATHIKRSETPNDGTLNAVPPTNPQGDLKFIPIRPKPAEPPKAAATLKIRTLRLHKLSSRKRCTVPICRRVGCRLQTHKNYVKVQSVSTYQQQQASKASRSHSPLLEGGFSGLPELPLGVEQPPIYRIMFHNFFNQEYDRIMLLLQPPPLSKEQEIKAAHLKKALLAQALQEPIFCLTYITSAYHSSVLSKPKLSSHDTNAAILHGRLVQLLRGKLADFKHEDAEGLLLVIFTLVLLDLAAHNYRNLEIHRAGMEQLVNSAGGVHNLVQSLPHTLNLDRIIAIHTARSASYGVRQSRALFRPSRFKHKYGDFFDASQDGWPKAVIDYCQDTCRAVELFEYQGIVFDPVKSKMAQSVDTHYFYFLRTHLADEFIHLNAEFADSYGKARCMLLATKIVDYLVLLDNYIGTIPVFLASKVRECLAVQEIAKEWSGMEDVLLWVLWVVACVPQIEENVEKEFKVFLVDQLETLYKGRPCLTDWNKKSAQYCSTRRFVWASALDDKLGQVCDELYRLLSERGVGLGQWTSFSESTSSVNGTS